MKIFVSDIDGTLYSHESFSIPELTKTTQAFQALKQRGIPIVFATARILAGCFSILECLHLKAEEVYLVTGNGAEVYHGKYIYEAVLPPTLIQELYDYALQHDLVLGVDQADCLLIQAYNSAFDEDRISLPIDLVVPHDFIKAIKHPVHKASLTGSEKQIAEYFTLVHQRFSPYVNVCRAGKDYIDITEKEHTKAYGLKILLEILQKQDDKVYYIGDSHNDLELMARADVVGAVANAIVECRALADIVVGSCEAGGVAEFIQWMLDEQDK